MIMPLHSAKLSPAVTNSKGAVKPVTCASRTGLSAPRDIHQRKTLRLRTGLSLPRRSASETIVLRSLGPESESADSSETKVDLSVEKVVTEELVAPESAESVSSWLPQVVRTTLVAGVVLMGMSLVTGQAFAVGAGSAGGQDWRFFAAGSLAAGLSHGYTTPLDVIKTRMQTNPEMYGGSVITAAKRIVKENGLLFLLQGLGPTVIGYGIEGGLKFGCYEFLKPLLANATPSTFVNFLLSSVIAGIVASIVLCPAEDVRIVQVANPNYGSNPLQVLLRIAKEKGPFSSFRGLPAMLCKQVPYTMAKQVSFDFVATCLYGVAAMLAINHYSFTPKLVLILAAFTSSCLSCIFSHPGDMVLTQFFKGTSTSTLATFREIIKNDGIAGLFVGIKARFLHVGAIITVQLCLYDVIKQALGLAATGAH